MVDMNTLLTSRRLPIILALLAGSVVPVAAQVGSTFPRTITGRVVDESELPVENAQVCAHGTRAMSGRLPCGTSNRAGRFAFYVYVADIYTITASSLEAGYPETWSFYRKILPQFPTITVSDENQLADVKVKVGPKAGRIILKIIDEDSKKPIEAGSITVRLPEVPNSYCSISRGFPDGRYEMLTPEGPFLIEFATWDGANRVKRFAFDESGTLIETLQVDLGARKEMLVRLK